MSYYKTGGSAFPCEGETITQGGMTLLDYFAAQALMGLMATKSSGTREDYAEDAFEYADMMIAERKKRGIV